MRKISLFLALLATFFCSVAGANVTGPPLKTVLGPPLGSPLSPPWLGAETETASVDWEAIITDSANDYGMELQVTGSGTPSVARTGGYLTNDVDGVYRTVAANTALWQGSRQVENLIRYNSDYDVAVWEEVSGGTIVDQGDGSGLITFTASNSQVHQYLPTATLPNLIGDLVASSANLTLTADWKRYSIYGANGPYEWVQSFYGKSGTATDVLFQNWVFDANGSVATIWVADGEFASDTIYIKDVQFELTKGNADPTIPSNYVPTGATAVTDYFGTKNANTVASNIVTESYPLLNSQPYMQVNPELTNICLRSNKKSVAPWTQSGTTAVDDTLVGLTGQTSTASSIEDDNASAAEGWYQAVTVTAAVQNIVIRDFIKRDRDETAYPLIGAQLTGGTAQTAWWQLNTATGATAPRTGTTNDASARISVSEFPPGWWEVLVEVENNGGNSTATIYEQPADGGNGSALGTTAPSAQGTKIYGGTELYENMIIEQVKGSPPLYTTSSEVSNTPQISTWDDLNHNTASGAYYFEYKGNVTGETELLIHSDTTDGSTTFTDSSVNARAMVALADAQHSTTQKKIGTTGMYFDGTDDTVYITDANASGLDFDRYDKFTIDAWVYPLNFTDYRMICGKYTGGRGYALSTDITNGKLQLLLRNTAGSSEIKVLTANGLTVNTWQHITVSYDGSAKASGVRIWINGVEETLTVSTDNLGNTFDNTSNFYIGQRDGTNTYEWAGYIDELMIRSRDDIFHSSTFTPPTLAHPDPSPLGKNPILATKDTDTVLKVSSNSFDGDTTIEDSSYLEETLAVTGNTHHDTAESKFNATSIKLDGTADYIQVPDTVNMAFPGAFTWEMFVKVVDATPQSPLFEIQTDTTTSTRKILYIQSEKLNFYIEPAATVYDATTTTVLDDTWHHVAITRDDSDAVRLFVDGTLQAIDGASTSVTLSGTFGTYGSGTQWDTSIGCDVNSVTDTAGWIDEVRMTKGTALYTANFTAPTEPFDRGTLSQVEMAYVKPSGNLEITDGTNTASATAWDGLNKCAFYYIGTDMRVNCNGTWGTADTFSGTMAGTLDMQILHGVISPANIRRVYGSSATASATFETWIEAKMIESSMLTDENSNYLTDESGNYLQWEN